ncbi:MAG: hypothetical protein J6C16_04180 [Clostridia bacterium]|nr:hypothetical protein [Clostridia bacterium]
MKKKITATAVAVVLVLTLVTTYMVYAQAGDDSDPIISLSYLKEVFAPEIKEELTFKVVTVESGKTVVCGAGTEVIQRMGTSEIVATEKGGIADTTVGTDLQNGTQTPSNHLLIIPVADGRGFKTSTECIFMIKGKYEIK